MPGLQPEIERFVVEAPADDEYLFRLGVGLAAKFCRIGSR